MSDVDANLRDPALVEAEPTKAFFVSMLVRDIDLGDSVVDLIDNCVDGARRQRGPGPYEGLWVDLRFDSTSFEIEDNCGGMDISIAREYAFRFGRDEDDPQRVDHSIGQFGVGMKRTLFKLGNRFVVESRTTTNSFTIDERVDEWRTRDDWNFRFTAYSDEDSRDLEECGTAIRVDELHGGVATELELEAFENELVRDVRLKHLRALAAGLAIRVNGVDLQAEQLRLVENDDIKPARWSHVYNGNREAVSLSMLVGVANASGSDGGWYVFCNDRLILGPDQTHATVWGPRAGLGLPGFHPEYHEFRGYAFFDSRDSSRLPWTTTKTGVDEDSAIWKHARRQMAELSKDVVRFLRLADRQADAARNAGEEDRADIAQNVLARSEPIPIDQVVGATQFECPTVDFTGLEPDFQFIRYRKRRREYEQVAELLGTDTPGEVGERTFDYFLRKHGD